MPIDGKLKNISLTSKTVDASSVEEKVEVDELDDKRKKELEEKLFASNMGKKLEEMLLAIQQEGSEETRRDKLVALLNDFFEVDGSSDEQVQRLVVDGKTYLRFALGDDVFDVELSDELMPSLVDWYIEMVTARVNEGAEEEKKIILKYEKEKEFIVKTQGELAALQKQVGDGSATTPSVAGGGMKWDDVRASFKKGDFQAGFKNFGSKVLSYFGFVEASSKAFASLGKTLQKDPAKAAVSEKKWYDFGAKLTSLKNTVASAFGMGPESPVA